MMKRILALVLCACLMIPCFALPANAEQVTSTVEWFDDGSSLETRTVESMARATNTKTVSRTMVFRGSDGNVDWEATLTATFTYDGTTSKATSASCSVDITDTLIWSLVSKYTVRNSNVATANITMKHSVLGVEIERPTYTITLTCDANGNVT